MNCCKCADKYSLNCICGVYDELDCTIEGCCWCCTFKKSQSRFSELDMIEEIKKIILILKRTKKVDSVVKKTVAVLYDDIEENREELIELLSSNYQKLIDAKTIDLAAQIEDIENQNNYKIRKLLLIWELYLEITGLIMEYTANSDESEEIIKFAYKLCEAIYEGMSQMAKLYAKRTANEYNLSLMATIREQFIDLENRLDQTYKNIEDMLSR